MSLASENIITQDAKCISAGDLFQVKPGQSKNNAYPTVKKKGNIAVCSSVRTSTNTSFVSIACHFMGNEGVQQFVGGAESLVGTYFKPHSLLSSFLVVLKFQ